MLPCTPALGKAVERMAGLGKRMILSQVQGHPELLTETLSQNKNVKNIHWIARTYKQTNKNPQTESPGPSMVGAGKSDNSLSVCPAPALKTLTCEATEELQRKSPAF